MIVTVSPSLILQDPSMLRVRVCSGVWACARVSKRSRVAIVMAVRATRATRRVRTIGCCQTAELR